MALKAVGKRESLSEKAYQMLRTAILEGELKPGEVLTEEGIADLLEISRTPVRSALQQLVLEGLLKSGGKNLIVAEVEEEEIRQIDQVRAELESLSAKLSCQRGLSEEQVKELREYCQRQNQAAEEKNMKEFFQAGESFHVRLASFSGNQYLAGMISQASASASRYLAAQSEPERFLDNSGTEHEAILDIILTGNEEQAQRRMRSHVEGENRVTVSGTSCNKQR